MFVSAKDTAYLQVFNSSFTSTDYSFVLVVATDSSLTEESELKVKMSEFSEAPIVKS